MDSLNRRNRDVYGQGDFQVPNAKPLDYEQVRDLLKDDQAEDKVGLNVLNPQGELPEVHPRLTLVEYYGRSDVLVKNEAYIPSKAEPKVKKGSDVLFNNLIELINEHRSVAFIGNAGSGKTILSRRLKKLARTKNMVPIRIQVMDLNYSLDHNLILEEFLIGNNFPGLNNISRASVYQFILNNQEQFVLILDGLDQAKWYSSMQCVNVPYDREIPVAQMVSNVLSGKFLPNMRLFITSRPHSMNGLVSELRPKETIYLQDLNPQDTETLFRYYAGDDADNLWRKLQRDSGQLVNFIPNPLMLQLIVISLRQPTKENEIISTMTQVFSCTLEHLRRSDFSRHDDLGQLTQQLSRLAFEATKSRTVLITDQHLAEQELNSIDIQDLIISIPAQRWMAQKMFEGDIYHYFSHQLLQEHYSALYIKNEMSLSDFKVFLQNRLFENHWSMVTWFLSGLLVQKDHVVPSSIATPPYWTKRIVDMALSLTKYWSYGEQPFNWCRNHTVIINEMALKRDMLLEETFRRFKKLTFPFSRADKRLFLNLLLDIRECDNDTVIEAAALHFPEIIDISYTIISISEAYAMYSVLRRVKKCVKHFDFRHSGLYSETFRLIAGSIHEMEGSIYEMRLAGNFLDSSDTKILCKILPKIDGILQLANCFKNEAVGTRWRLPNDVEKNMLQTSLNQCNSNLEISLDDRSSIFSESNPIQA